MGNHNSFTNPDPKVTIEYGPTRIIEKPVVKYEVEPFDASAVSLQPGEPPYVSYNNHHFVFGLPRGEKGEQGIPGERGAQGPQGITGAQGPTGPQGKRGAQGPKGDRGERGPAGEAGKTGPQGPKGPKGDQGLRGYTGPKGDRGPQGPKGDDYVLTESDMREIAGRVVGEMFAPVISETAGPSSGPDDMASFPDGFPVPLNSLVVNIVPEQDMHGYDHPWPIGGGTNRFFFGTVEDTNQYISATNGGTVTPTNATVWRSSDYIAVTPGEELYCGEVYTTGTTAGTAFYDASKVYISGVSATALESASGVLTVPSGAAYMRHSFRIDEGYNVNWQNSVYIVLNSDAHEWTPYANVCPINGYYDAKVYISPTQYASDGRVYSYRFPDECRTVYNGLLDAVNGTLTVYTACEVLNGTEEWGTYGNNSFVYTAQNMKTGMSLDGISSFLPTVSSDSEFGIQFGRNNTSIYCLNITNKIPGVTSRSEWKEYLALHHLTVVYPLPEPITYQFEPAEIEAYPGTNNVWSDCGAVTVGYSADTKLYINKIISEILNVQP